MPREEREIVPPPRIAVAEYQTPAPSVVLFSELVDRLDPAYQAVQPIARGTLYSTIRGADPNLIAQYPTLYFLKESRLGNSDRLVIWTWSTVPSAEDSYNAEIDYSSESTAAPRFTRIYTIRRDAYEIAPIKAIGSALDGIISIQVQNGGGGYSSADTLNFTGGGGTGVQAELVVDSNGVIQSVVILSEGSGFISPPTITITSANGAGAILLAILQSQIAVLVSQKKSELPENDPLRNEFVRVVRVYETLPGPWLFSTRFDEDGDVITVQTRRNVSASIVTQEQLLAGVWSQTTKKAVDNFVAEETQESRIVPGDKLLTTSRVDEDGVTITVTRQVESAADLAALSPREYISAGTWFRISSEPITDIKVWKVVEARVLPGNNVPAAAVESDNVIRFDVSVLQPASAVTPSVSLLGNVITKVDQKEVSELVSKQVTSTKAIFDAASFGVKIPILIPEKFRGLTPVSDIKHVLPGTATLPSLGVGEFERVHTQEAVFVQSQRVLSINTTLLPVSLIDYKMTQYGEVETIVETINNGLQTINPNVLTVEAEVDNLGNNLSVSTVGTVQSLFTRPSYQITRPDLLPEKFRADIPITTTEVDIAGTASLPTLNVGEFSKTQTQLTLFKYRQTTTARISVALPVSVLETKLTGKGQIESIVETLNTGFQTFTPTALYIEAGVEDLGDGTSIMTVGTVPTLFTEPAFTSKIPDVVPERFRVAIPTQTTEQLVAGTASMPSLAPGQLESSQSQQTVFLYRSRVTARAAVALPVSLTSYKYSKDKQVVTVLETYASGLQTITPAALLVEAEVINTGDGNSLQSLGTVASLFTGPSYTTTIPDPIPERFRVVVPTAINEISSIGTASPPTLGPGDLEITQSQVDAFVMRTRTRTRSGVTLPVSLVSYKVTKDKQVATVTETLASGLQTITPDSLTSEAEVINLGNATSLKIQGEVASLFAGKSTTTKIDDLVPREFLGVVQTFITSQLIAGTIVDPPVLSTGDLEKTETQVDVFNKRVDIKTRAGITLPITLTGGKKIVSRFGVQLIADEVITLAVSGTQTIPPTGPNLIDAAIKQIGSGMEVLTTLTVTGGIWPTITSKFFDEEMQVFNTQDQQIVDPSYTPASSSNYVEQTRALDQWHSRRIRSNRTAGAVSKATALISIDYRPYSFPGTFDYSTYLTFLHGTGYRRSVASVSKHTIRTWWLYRNPGPPTVGPTGTGMDVEIDDIVTDTVNIPIYATGNITLFERFPNVLHDAIVTTQGLVYPATTPSFSQYFRGSVSGTGVVNSVSLFSPGNGYAVGNVLNISDGSGHNVQVQITRLGVSNSILAWTQLSPGNYPNPAAPNPNVYGPFAGGGSGTGALFYVDAVTVTSSAPGTAWVGTERAIGCKVTPTNIPFLWKIQLISTIMR